MALVDYSDSDSESDGKEETEDIPPAKKRRLSASETDATTTATPAPAPSTSTLPPLPASFRDLYSSTVRTSTQDDPALHAGRKRVIPHVVGNWPTHVYLEWCPDKPIHQLLCDVVDDVRQALKASSLKQNSNDVHSLLENELGVQLPLHVSLSRPMALKTDQKDNFFPQLRSAIAAVSVRAFTVGPLDLIWHANEDRTRWFLVLRLRRPDNDELRKLLNSCNGLARTFGQPLLYEAHRPEPKKGDEEQDEPAHDSFHISIAWCLRPVGADEHRKGGRLPQSLPPTVLERLQKLNIGFDEVKVRIGQDVSSHTLPKPRKATA